VNLKGGGMMVKKTVKEMGKVDVKIATPAELMEKWKKEPEYKKKYYGGAEVKKDIRE